MPQRDLRRYESQARSTDVFGRVLCTARNHHIVVDGPEQNGCPGEALTPGEIFLAGIAACAVELTQVIAKKKGIPLGRVAASMSGEFDRNNPVRPDLTIFRSVRLSFTLGGVNRDQARELVDAFKAT